MLVTLYRGEKLTDQELLNAVYSCPWTSDAKRHFSKPGCPAQKIASSYMDGSPIRQVYRETALGIRAFNGNTRLEAYERQHGVCPLCVAHFELSEMEADHITPWRDGGHTIPANCQMLCRDCNRCKGAK